MLLQHATRFNYCSSTLTGFTNHMSDIGNSPTTTHISTAVSRKDRSETGQFPNRALRDEEITLLVFGTLHHSESSSTSWKKVGKDLTLSLEPLRTG